MTREEQEALNAVGEATPEIESPTIQEEAPEEVPEEVVEEASPDAEDTAGEGAEPELTKKKGAEARIRELNAKLRKAEERNRSLETTVGKVHKESEENPFSPENNPLPDADLAKPNENGEITREQYEADVERRAKRAVQSVLTKQTQKMEAAQAMELYPQLNPKKHDIFDEDISDVVMDAVEAQTKLNPNASVLAIVQKVMKPYQKAGENAVTGQQQEIARQAAQAGIRPTQNLTPAKKKTVEEMSEAEIEAQYGKVYH